MILCRPRLLSILFDRRYEMKKENYTAPQISIIDLAEKVSTATLASANNEEGSSVLVSWLIG